eukprot:60190-Chlamydomonas_euryale.AAC.4
MRLGGRTCCHNAHAARRADVLPERARSSAAPRLFLNKRSTGRLKAPKVWNLPLLALPSYPALASYPLSCVPGVCTFHTPGFWAASGHVATRHCAPSSSAAAPRATCRQLRPPFCLLPPEP